MSSFLHLQRVADQPGHHDLYARRASFILYYLELAQRFQVLNPYGQLLDCHSVVVVLDQNSEAFVFVICIDDASRRANTVILQTVDRSEWLCKTERVVVEIAAALRKQPDTLPTESNLAAFLEDQLMLEAKRLDPFACRHRTVL